MWIQTYLLLNPFNVKTNNVHLQIHHVVTVKKINIINRKILLETFFVTKS